MKKRCENLTTKYARKIGSAFSAKGKERLLAKFMRAVHLYDKGKYEGALKAFQKMKEMCTSVEDTTGVFLFEAMCFEKLRRQEDARTTYEVLLKRNENCPEALVGLGYLFQANAKPEAAIEQYQKAIMLDANNAMAFCRMSEVLYGLKRYEEAVATALHALGLDDTLHTAAGVVCLSYAVLGNKEMSQKFFDIAVQAGADEKGLRTTMKSHFRRRTGLNKKYFE